MPRPEREAFVDDDGGEVRVEDGRAERVLEAADEDRLVDERILRPAKPAPLRGESGPACGWRPGDDQDLEIGPMAIRAPKRRRQYIRRHALVILVRVPIAGVLAERSGEHGAGDATGEGCGRGRIIGRGMIAQRRQQLEAGIGVEFLGRRHLGERGLECLPGCRSRRTRPRPLPPGDATDRRALRDLQKIDRFELLECWIPLTWSVSSAAVPSFVISNKLDVDRL